MCNNLKYEMVSVAILSHNTHKLGGYRVDLLFRRISVTDSIIFVSNCADVTPGFDGYVVLTNAGISLSNINLCRLSAIGYFPSWCRPFRAALKDKPLGQVLRSFLLCNPTVPTNLNIFRNHMPLIWFVAKHMSLAMNDKKPNNHRILENLSRGSQPSALKKAADGSNPPIATNGRFAELLQRLEEAEEKQR